ncbi:hypothetical protein IGB42_04056 [Andreprevotia sp. IGB-42]|nr:hypothetical protein IGB42_04056 [Andreprevotia sp. IGB-42]
MLICSSEYEKVHAPLLREIFASQPILFYAVGPGCESWEDAMDWLCVALDYTGEVPGAFVVTTCHPDEALDEAIEFAGRWAQLAEPPGLLKVMHQNRCLNLRECIALGRFRAHEKFKSLLSRTS